MIDSHADQVDWAKTRVEMDRIIQVVRTFIPSERWPEVVAAVNGDTPIRKPEAQGVDGIRMVEIDDTDDDGY